MREYIYKVIIFVVAMIVIYEFTLGKQISQINDKVNYFTSSEGRKEIIFSLKKEIKKATAKDISDKVVKLKPKRKRNVKKAKKKV